MTTAAIRFGGKRLALQDEVGGTGVSVGSDGVSVTQLFQWGKGVYVPEHFDNPAGPALGNATGDDWAPLQAALDAAIQYGQTGKGNGRVVLSGRYRITEPLLGLYREGATYRPVSFSLVGVARGYQDAKRTEIIPAFTDGPAVVVQKGRAVAVRGFSIRGPNQGLGNATHMPSLVLDEVGTPWWNVAGMRDSTYSPACGIAIDPFSNGLPSDGGYPGLAAYYTDNNSGSSGIYLENLESQGFICGVAVSLSPSTQLGDTVIIRDCNLSVNKVALAIGQSQNRGVVLENVHCNGCQVLVDTVRYGVGTGPLPHILGGVVTHAKWLLIGNSNWGQGQCTSLYVESLYSLGFWGSNSGRFKLTFSDCHIKFAILDPGIPEPDAHGHFGGPVEFRGGYLGHYSNAIRRLSFYASNIEFDGVVMDGEPNVASGAALRFSNCPLAYSSGGNKYGISDRFSESMSILGLYGALAAPYAEVHQGAGTSYMRWVHRGGYDVLTFAGVVITANGDGTGSFDSATAAAQLQVGDWPSTITVWNGEKYQPTQPTVSYAGLSIGRVASIVGTVVTLNRMPKSLASGTYTVTLQRLPVIRQRTVGTLATGTNTITGVTPTAGWVVGDRIKGTGIPGGTFITNITGTTFTISQNATQNGIVDLYDAQMWLDMGTRSAALGAPSTGSWFQGDYFRNTTPTKNANSMILEGWLCTVTGAQGTWESRYVSTVTPAT